MRPKSLAPTQLLPVAAKLSAELPRTDTFGHSSGSWGQQAGVGASRHFSRLVSEAGFSPELRALLLVPEKQPWPLRKFPGTSARHVSTPGQKIILPRVAMGLLTAMPASESTTPYPSPSAPAKVHLIRSRSAGCLLQASAPTPCSSRP